MRNLSAGICIALVLSVGAPFASAQSDNSLLETDWIELVKGYKGETVGAELREIEPADDEGTRKITLAIPKTAISHPDKIDEVVVVGKKPDKPEPLLDVQLEWLDDYDNDNYGLVIYLSEDSNWPIRLFMSSEAGFIR